VPPITNRTERIILRVSPAEKALIAERAAGAGLGLSAFIRREAGIGHFGSKGRPDPAESGYTRPEAASDFEERVREFARTMPRRNAETAVRREDARRKAAAAIAAP
jgi:Mobilization protein NikA